MASRSSMEIEILTESSLNMKVIGKKIRSAELGQLSSRMAHSMRENLKVIISTDKANLSGHRDTYTPEAFAMARSKDLVSSLTQVERI